MNGEVFWSCVGAMVFLHFSRLTLLLALEILKNYLESKQSKGKL